MDKRNENYGLPYDRCYYPHRLKGSLSPVCGIFSSIFCYIFFAILCRSQYQKKNVINLFGLGSTPPHPPKKCNLNVIALPLFTWFLAALSSSRSLVVRPSVCWLFGQSENFVKKWPLQYQLVTKTYLQPTYLLMWQ